MAGKMKTGGSSKSEVVSKAKAIANPGRKITGKPPTLAGQLAGSKTAGKKPVKAPAKPAAPAVPSLADWLGSDSTYLDTQTSVNKALSDQLADVASQRSTYDQTYNQDLHQLGWTGAGWNTADPLTQSGKAFSQQANDFAARGMLQSSGYGDAFTNTGRALDQQKSTSDLSRQNWMTNMDAYSANQQGAAVDALTQAKREAISRRAVKYSSAANGVLSA